MWVFFSAALFVGYVLRRYKVQRYSTQKFSRRCDCIKKTAVVPLKVPWIVKHNDYNPLGDAKETMFWWFHLTRVDGSIRFLVEVSPYMFCRVPFNPFGRTGVVGKGLFAYCGPNNITLTIICCKSLGFLKVVYLKKGKLLYTGYLDHPMNTANAWFEATIYYYEVQEEQCPEWITAFGEQGEQCPEWLTAFVKGYCDVSQIK